MNRFGLFFVMLLAFLCLTLFNEGIIKILAKLLVEFKKIKGSFSFLEKCRKGNWLLVVFQFFVYVGDKSCQWNVQSKSIGYGKH